MSNLELERMKTVWIKISSHFPQAHHFSSEKFTTKPPSLERFYEYCSDKEVRGENLQTICRALEISKLVEEGDSIDTAVRSAWMSHPIVTR